VQDAVDGFQQSGEPKITHFLAAEP
jgi:hypothetical protein